MSNRVLIHISSGNRYIPENKARERLFDKLALSDAYMWEGDTVEVSLPQAAQILETERLSLVKERQEFEQEKEAFYAEKVQAQGPTEIINIEQPVKRRGRQLK